MINLLKSLGSEVKFNKNKKIVKITKKKKQSFFLHLIHLLEQ
jgi:hypothetical protein